MLIRDLAILEVIVYDKGKAWSKSEKNNKIYRIN